MKLGCLSLLLIPALGLSALRADPDEGVQLVAAGAEVRKLAGDFRFTEGPAADSRGNVYFTDIPNSRIHKWSVDGKLSTFSSESGGANGLFFDRHGNLLACQGRDRQIVSFDSHGRVTALVTEFQGKRFNSPNDLWLDPRGGIYFTDPRYGNRDGMEQDGEHVYYLSPDRRKLTRVVDDMVRPNGLVGTPDGKRLYVTDHGGNQTFVYQINPDGSLAGKQLLASIGSDGMTLDEQGNLYLTADSVRVYSPSGELREEIVVPERPANVCFGGTNGKTLFITARTSLYAVDMAVAGSPTKWGQWTTLSCSGKPDARHETTFVEQGGKFYMIGGRESQRIDCFDPGTCTWTKKQATSPLIHHFQPVVWGDKIYMVGAMTGNYPKEPPMSHVQIYDPQRDRWSEGDEIPPPRRRGSAGTVVYGDKIYMACGITLGHTSGTTNLFDEYDPATGKWRELPPAPHARDHFHAAVVGDKLYCVGGRNTSYHEPGNFGAFFGAVIPEIDCYDFSSGAWTTLDSRLPIGTAAGGIATLDDRIIYFGGENAQTAQANAWLFDPSALTWTALADLNQGRHGSQAVVYAGKVYIAGGSPKRGGGKLDSIEMFSF